METGMEESMVDFVVHCRWPDGGAEWFFSDDEAEARAWAADARADSGCVAGVYGLLVVETPHGAATGGCHGRYAGMSVGPGTVMREAGAPVGGKVHDVSPVVQ